MKKLILTLAVLVLATALAFRFAVHPVSGPVEATSEQTPVKQKQPEVVKLPAIALRPAPTAAPHYAPRSAETPTADAIAFAAAIDTLVSPTATWPEKQAVWKQLLDAGRIQDVLSELEQRAANDPNNSDILATLGQAYLKACGTTKDVRSQAVWAMQADKSFENALAIDPSNWVARYTKAVAMTYWPADLNKGPEIVDQFNTLIQQQEKQPPQPHFAQTYDWLGRQYEKMGQPELAQQAWARGAALFPDNQTLQSRLAQASTAGQ